MVNAVMHAFASGMHAKTGSVQEIVPFERGKAIYANQVVSLPGRIFVFGDILQ